MRYKAKTEYNSDNEEIMNEYVFKKELGQGAFARVILAERTIVIDGNKSTLNYAIKIMNKNILKKKTYSEYDKEG